jgi:protein-S-isoprenylcysteine O-methyltransferase Ste14
VSFAERGGWWVVLQLALFGLFAAALVGTDPLSEGIGIEFARGTGLVLIVAAGVIAVWTLRLMGWSMSIFPAPSEDSPMVRSGPYRVVRHPMYLAVILGAIGLALVALSPFALVAALIFIPFFMSKTGHEEELLIERYPEYREYRSVVPYRLIPYVM